MRILFISCGGTIVSADGQNTDIAALEAVENAAGALLKEVWIPRFKQSLLRRAKDSAEQKAIENDTLIDTLDLLSCDSTEIGPLEWRKIAECIVDNYDRYDGFILAHGTNTLSYSASAIRFALPLLGKPIVLTGSNTPMGLPYSDAQVNFSNAVLVVQKLIQDGLPGVSVVFASRIMPGVRTKKANGTEWDAFKTFNAPDLGQIRTKGEVVINMNEYRRYFAPDIEGSPWQGKPPAKKKIDLLPFVYRDFQALISSHTFHPGDDPRTYLAVMEVLLKLKKESGLRGALIIRAVGDGDTSKIIQAEVLQQANDMEIPIVLTTQEPQGTSRLQANAQSAQVMSRTFAIPAWDMNIETMVVKMRYLLNRDLGYNEIVNEFAKNYFGEINIKK
jgi:L-asparaginase